MIKLRRKIPSAITVGYIIQYNLVIVSFILVCFYYWYTRVLAPLNDQVNINYLIALSLILSFDYSKIDRFKVISYLSLPVCAIFIRRWLIIWTIIVLVYQIDYYKIKIKKIALIAIFVISIELFFQIESLLMGFLEDETRILLKSERPVHNFGMNNSNQFGMIIFELCNMLYLYLGVKKGRRFSFCIISFIIGTLMFFFTSSRTAYYGIIILIIVASAYWLKKIPNFLRFPIGLLPILSIGLNIYIAFHYAELSELNEISTGRAWYITKYLSDVSPNEMLLGSIVETNEPVDGTYLEMMLKGGIFLCSLFALSFFISCTKDFDKIKLYLPVAISTLVAGISETIFTAPSPSTIIVWMITLYHFIKQKPIY